MRALQPAEASEDPRANGSSSLFCNSAWTRALANHGCPRTVPTCGPKHQQKFLNQNSSRPGQPGTRTSLLLDVQSTFQQYAWWLADYQGNSHFYWLSVESRRDFGAVSDGPIARVFRVPIGSSREPQDGGDSYLRRGRPEPGSHSRPERHHQLPEEEQGLWGWRRCPSAAVHCGHATVGAEWTAAGVNRAPSPGPAPRSVQIDEGAPQGKLGEGPPGAAPHPHAVPSPTHPSPLHKRGQGSLLW